MVNNDILANLVNNPNFGRSIGGSTYFQSMFMGLLSGSPVSDLFPRLKIGEGGKLIDPIMGETHTPRSGESYGEFLHRMTSEVRFGYTQRKAYGSDLGQLYFSGADSNLNLHELVGRYNQANNTALSARITTYKPAMGESPRQVRSALDKIAQRGKDGELLGLLRPDSENWTFLELLDNKGRAVDVSTIQQVFGIDLTGNSKVFKRLGALLNDRAIQRVTPEGTRAKVLLINPEELFAGDDKIQKVVERITKTGVERHKAFEMMMDGYIGVSAFELKEQINTTTHQLKTLRQQLNKMPKGTRAYLEKLENINKLQSSVDSLRNDLKRGRLQGGWNLRIVNAVHAEDTAKTFHYGKGDAGFMSDDRIFQMARTQSRFSSYSDDALRDILKSVSFVHVMEKDPIQDVLGRATGSTLISAFRQPAIEKEAYSEMITMAALGDIYNPKIGDTHLSVAGLTRAVRRDIEMISQGKIPEGLPAAIESMLAEPMPVNLSTAEQMQWRNSRRYAEKIKAFLDSGLDLSKDPYMMEDMIRVVKQHHFQVNNRLGEGVSFDGKTVPAYKLRAPMEMSPAGHIRNMVPMELESELSQLPGMLRMDQEDSRFIFHPSDILTSHKALGGFDLDDTIYNGMRYDPKSRRALYATIRHPNQMGEYMFYGADILFDSSIPAPIRAMEAERRRLVQKVANTRNVDGLSNEINRIQELADNLNEYFSSNIEAKIDLAEMYRRGDGRLRFAPIGFKYSEEALRDYETTLDPLRAFVGIRDFGGDVTRFQASARSAASAAFGNTVFEFVGGDYNEYLEMGLFKQNETISGIIARSEKQVAKFTPELAEARLASELEASGFLGRFVNPMAVAQDFVRRYSDVSNYGNVDQQKALLFQQEFLRRLRETPLGYVDREKIIDAFTKSGASELVNEVVNLISSNGRNMATLIKDMQKYAKDIDLDMNVGLDPILFQSRGKGMLAAMEAVLGDEGLGTIMLPDDDPTAMITNIYRQTHEFFEDLNTKIIPEAKRAGAQNLLDELAQKGFAPTPEESLRAQEFIRNYTTNLSELAEFHANQENVIERLTKALGDNVSAQDVLAPYTQDAIQARSLSLLKNWGLFDDPTAMDRQLLAIAQLGAQWMTGEEGMTEAARAFGSLMGHSGLDDLPSIEDMYRGALARLSRHSESIVNRISDYSDIALDNTLTARDIRSYYSQFYKKDRRTGNLRLTGDAGSNYVNQIEIVRALRQRALRTQQMLDENVGLGLSYDEVKAAQAQQARVGRRIQSIISDLDNILGGAIPLRDGTYTPPPPSDVGLGRYMAREASDTIAEDVTAAGIIDTSKTAIMKRLDTRALQQLFQERVFRNSAIGFGIFAGIGLLYGARKDRTPEEVQGPPLLPGGSAYEGYDTTPANMSSIYSAPQNTQQSGILYRVNMHGSFDANKMRNSLRQITGSPIDMRTYSSRQTLASRQSSADIINSMVG